MDETRQLLNEITATLKETLSLQHDLQKNQGDIILESERRVSNVNNMVDNLSRLIERLENTYDYHLKEVERSRDKLIEQNEILIRQNGRMMNKIEKLEARCQATHNEYMDYLKQLVGRGNNVNVYHQND